MLKNRILPGLLLLINITALADGEPVIKYEGSSTVGLLMKDVKKIYKKEISANKNYFYKITVWT